MEYHLIPYHANCAVEPNIDRQLHHYRDMDSNMHRWFKPHYSHRKQSRQNYLRWQPLSSYLLVRISMLQKLNLTISTPQNAEKKDLRNYHGEWLYAICRDGPKKSGGHIKSHAQNVCIRLVKGLYESYQSYWATAFMSNRIINFAGEHPWSARLASRKNRQIVYLLISFFFHCKPG